MRAMTPTNETARDSLPVSIVVDKHPSMRTDVRAAGFMFWVFSD